MYTSHFATFHRHDINVVFPRPPPPFFPLGTGPCPPDPSRFGSDNERHVLDVLQPGRAEILSCPEFHGETGQRCQVAETGTAPLLRGALFARKLSFLS